MEIEFKPLLSQAVGYGVVVGVGFFFAGLMLVITFLQRRFTTLTPSSSEEFSSASRNVKPGLICCGIVSAWTWSATLLQSSISGPWWYGVGGTIQLSIFTMIAAKIKMNANGAHTFLEIVKVRFGTSAHLLFTFYGVLCNLIRNSDILGSPTAMYDLLVEAAAISPVPGNQDGSYLTMKSNQGLVFGAATILSGFAGIFCDQGYWQRAIASAPESTTKAYPAFPTFPAPLSAFQTSAGLAAPAAAAVLMGKGGAIAILLVVFMAVTSASSAELIAVSSIFSYDLYRTYWRKDATGAEIVRVSHIFIGVWAIWMGAWAVINHDKMEFYLHRANIDLGWLFYVQGVVLSPAVIPIGLTVTWSKLSKVGVFAGTLTGFVTGMLAWMIGCWKIYAPANYDFSGTRAITTIDPIMITTTTTTQSDDHSRDFAGSHDDIAKNGKEEDGKSWIIEQTVVRKEEVSREELQRVFKKAAIPSLTLTVIVMLIWALLAGGFCILLPIWESKDQILSIVMESTIHGSSRRRNDSERPVGAKV
ncbi:hypothetical protein Clacol_004704 [Clathrus columnatus]|uniref:Uncharacterized protein n=1 Tax=Clathrus columnatus TaxID=1419009 RepID=A0AAV5ABD0_9AGAM|nr:hypothetical protein Clacol_004704 [Clathrus columnatus]